MKNLTAEQIALILYPEDWVENASMKSFKIDNNAGRRAVAVKVAGHFLMQINSLLNACQKAYLKHHKDDDSIGWNELSDILHDALCNAMGEDEFIKWND